MTASTTGLACSSNGVSFAAMRSSARATSRPEYKRRAVRRTSSTSAGTVSGSTLERELRPRVEGRDERIGFLPVGRGMQTLPIETPKAVQPREPQLRGRVDVALQ